MSLRRPRHNGLGNGGIRARQPWSRNQHGTESKHRPRRIHPLCNQAGQHSRFRPELLVMYGSENLQNSRETFSGTSVNAGVLPVYRLIALFMVWYQHISFCIGEEESGLLELLVPEVTAPEEPSTNLNVCWVQALQARCDRDSMVKPQIPCHSEGHATI